MLENQHHELEQWEAALQQQMVLQCLSSARQHAPADRAEAVRRCEARTTRRARSSLRTSQLAPLGGGVASMATRRRGIRRSRGFTLLRSYKPTAIDQVTPTVDMKPPEPSAPKSEFFEDPGSGHGGRWGRGGDGLLPGQHDPKVELMRQAGIRMDDWPGVVTPHAWGPDGRDHYNGSAAAAAMAAAAFHYTQAERPYWAFINHALRSQPIFYNPEGVANKRLMRGSMYIADDWSNRTAIEHPHRSAEDRNHFGPWNGTSPKNVRLLYGLSSFFNGRLPVKDKKGKKAPADGDWASPIGPADPWSLDDKSVDVQGALKNVTVLKDLVRRLGIAERRVKCWGGQKCCKPDDLIEAGKLMEEVGAPRQLEDQALLISALGGPALNFNQTVPSQGRLRLESHGVNVAGYSFA
jgi:hypothetical protein